MGVWRTFHSKKWKGIYCPEWSHHLSEAQWLVVLFGRRPNGEAALKDLGSLTWWGWWDMDIREARWTHTAIRSQVNMMISMSRKMSVAARIALVHSCSEGEKPRASLLCLPQWSKLMTSLELWAFHPWYQNSGPACHQFCLSPIWKKRHT